jgi:hypothetical protein
MLPIAIARPSRNTPATVVRVFGVDILFSYTTAVGCSVPGKAAFRLKNYWGPTTGRHLKEWGYMTPGVEELTDAEFEQRLTDAIYERIAELVTVKLEDAA